MPPPTPPTPTYTHLRHLRHLRLHPSTYTAYTQLSQPSKRYLEVTTMPWQCPYTPLELHQFNPHGFDYGDRVVLPDGRTGMVSKVGYKYGHVDADTAPDWKGLLVELRPAVPDEVGLPRVQQLSLL